MLSGKVIWISLFLFVMVVLFVIFFICIHKNFKYLEDQKDLEIPPPIITRNFENCVSLSDVGICEDRYKLKWCVNFVDPPKKSPSFLFEVDGKTEKIFTSKNYVLEEKNDGIYKYSGEISLLPGEYIATLTTLLGSESSVPSKLLKIKKYKVPEGGYKIENITYVNPPDYLDETPIYSQNDQVNFKWDPPVSSLPQPTFEYYWTIKNKDRKFFIECDNSTNTEVMVQLTSDSSFNKTCKPPKIYLEPGDYETAFVTKIRGCPESRFTQKGPEFIVRQCLSNEDCTEGEICANSVCVPEGPENPPKPVFTGTPVLDLTDVFYFCDPDNSITYIDWYCDYTNSIYQPEDVKFLLTIDRNQIDIGYDDVVHSRDGNIIYYSYFLKTESISIYSLRLISYIETSQYQSRPSDSLIFPHQNNFITISDVKTSSDNYPVNEPIIVTWDFSLSLSPENTVLQGTYFVVDLELNLGGDFWVTTGKTEKIYYNPEKSDDGKMSYTFTSGLDNPGTYRSRIITFDGCGLITGSSSVSNSFEIS